MMLKVNGEYLDFNGDIEIEKKIKLFEDIDTTDGDLSFAFDIDLTSENLRILGIPVPDSISKTVYQFNDCIVQNDSGVTVNNGSLRIESISGYIASCSFLGGNSNWFALLDGDMTELRLSNYDRDLNETEIVNSWSETEGLIFPFLDIGALITRGAPVAKSEDFTGCFYLHTLFKEVFLQSGIKIQGDFLNDSLFKQALVVTNTRSVVDKNNNSFYASTDTPQSCAASSTTQLTLEDQTTPFYVGSSINVVGNKDFYISANMAVEIDVSILASPAIAQSLIPRILINGVFNSSRLELIRSSRVTSSLGRKRSGTYRVKINSGEYITLGAKNDYGGSAVISNSAYMKLTPIIIYKSFGSSCVPLWTKQKFISNIINNFNVISSYNQFTKTLTLDLFDGIKTKESIDIGEFIQVDKIDYSEFISNYGKVNNFSYNEGSDEDLREYNIGSYIKYGAGTIESNNYFLEQSFDIITSDFTAPISYLNGAFNCSTERVNFVDLEEGDDTLDITSVTDSGGIARFNIANADDLFSQFDLVRVDSVVYDGDFVVNTVTSTYVEFISVEYISDTTGTAKRLTFSVNNSDDVFLLIQIPLKTTTDIMDVDSVYFESTTYSNWSLAFFNLIKLGRNIEDQYKQSLAFNAPDNITSFQKTLIDKYWKQFERILNDPVKLLTTGYLPWKVYNSIDFLQPITIRTKETSNLYYVNRILGYKDSSIGCEIDLIKLP